MRVAVGLGGNLGGEPAVTKRMAEAVRRLAAREGGARVSSLYRSAPLGPIAAQADFLNAVVVLAPAAARPPATWLADLLSLEAELGRVRRQDQAPGGPRPIDLDLLAVGDLREERPGLSLPHPRAAERAFVLLPLVELCGPRVRLPGWSRTAAELLENSPACAQAVERLCGPEWADLGEA